MIRVRFAPSPTGYIHIGNARIALFNALFILNCGKSGAAGGAAPAAEAGAAAGRAKAKADKPLFILRYDDTDKARSRQEYIDGIAEDLAWLGIQPDEIYFQSARFDRYQVIIAQLKQAGLLYPCYETAAELEMRRKIRLSRRLPPIYGREALKLTEAEKQAYEAQGRQPHWRFLLPNYQQGDVFALKRSEIHWDDAARGPQTVDLASISDPVLVRGDGSYLYTLPSVVDDMDMGVSHIIRGDDHVTNTGVQIALFEALGAAVPVFGHINLLTMASGEELSKRKGALSIRSLREEGFEPMAVASLAALTGTAENITAYHSLAELAAHFSLQGVSKSAAKFDPADLLLLNRHLIHDMPYEAAQARLEEQGIKGEKVRPFWQAIRGNIDKITEAKDWWPVVADAAAKFAPAAAADAAFLAQAAELLPAEPWSGAVWAEWIAAVKKASGRKGKALFHPLRQALTGRDSGPELAELLPLIGREAALKRLTAAAGATGK